MTNKEYQVKGHTMPGALTAIVLKNNDTVTHGFSSSLFKDVQVRKEGDAVEVKGKGVRSFHVDPGKTATLYFTKGHSAERETMQYPFWCDIHANMSLFSSSSNPNNSRSAMRISASDLIRARS